MDDLICIERRKLRKSASRHEFGRTGGPVLAYGVESVRTTNRELATIITRP